MSVSSRSADIRRQLRHPVIDCDGHWLEPVPVLVDYLKEIAGPDLVADFRKNWATLTGRGWYDVNVSERMRHRMSRPPWWTVAGNTRDRATGFLPGLLNERLEEFGIDFSIVYPSLGLFPFTLRDEALRRALTRALNVMTADLFRPYGARLAPVAVVTNHTPAEAIAEAEFAVKELGYKAILTSGYVRRPIAADADWQPDVSKRRQYIDCVAMDSTYDYDPFWAKCMELKVAVGSHIGSMGWMDRTSPTNFVGNHLGHFAQSHHLFARGLFLGGVVQRFPNLNFAFLEGGAGWGCNLLADLVGHWKKRNRPAMLKTLDPAILDAKELKRLFDQYAVHPRYRTRIEETIDHGLIPGEVDRTARQLSERDLGMDEFAAVSVPNADAIRRVFSERFFFGCEADDPMAVWAMNTRLNRVRLNPIFSSDIGHFDVTNMNEVLEEAFELVEDGFMTDEEFRAFTFGNAVALHGRMNADFFKGTVVESAAKQALEGALAPGALAA